MTQMRLEEIRADPSWNIRRSSEPSDELVASVREHGVLEPVLVRKADGRLVVGFRRYEAARKAGLTEIPVVLGDWSDAEIVAVQLVENLQRADLDPIEEALAIQRYLETTKATQKVAARVVAKSQAWVANRIRLLGLPAEVKDLVAAGAISPKHAERLLTIETPALQTSEAASAAQHRKTVDEMDKDLEGIRQVEAFFKRVAFARCPTCETEVTPQTFLEEGDAWYLSYMKSSKRLDCLNPDCGASWDVETGKVTTRPGPEAAGGHGSGLTEAARAEKGKERAKAVKKAKQAAALAPLIRSTRTPLEWLRAWVDGLKEDDVERIDLVRGEKRWSALEPSYVAAFVRPAAVPFVARIRAVDYTTGEKTQVHVDARSVGIGNPGYYSPGPADQKVVASAKADVAAWERKRLGKARETKAAKDVKADALDGSVDEVVATLQKIREMEVLEGLRAAEVAGKGRLGVLEAVDGMIITKGRSGGTL